MTVFGKRLAELRKERNLTQTQLAKQMSTSLSVISRYERGEMTPSIATAKTLADILNTTVGYLLGENDNADLLKDPDMVKRFKEIIELKSKDKEHVIFTLDAMIRAVKLRELAS